MKISVQFEADSADDYDRIIAALSGPGRSLFHVNQPVEVAVTEPPVVSQDAVSPVPQQATPEPESPQIEPSEVEKPAKRTRGPNKPKMAPIVEEPEDEPMEVAPPVLKTPVGPAPKIEVQPVASRQDLLDVFSEYVQRYGINFGYTDISNLLQKNLGDGVRKASDVPDEALSKAVVAIRAAINDNPFNRKRDYA